MRAYNQRAHIDSDESKFRCMDLSIVLHIPLSFEDMYLSAWNDDDVPELNYTPIASLAILENDQVHAVAMGIGII